MDAIGTVLDRLHGLLGRSYVLAGFLPAFVAAAASLALWYLVEPETHYILVDFFSLGASQQVLFVGAILMTLAVAGFVLWSFNSWIRSVMSGNLPELLASMLRAREQERFDQLMQTIRNLTPDYVAYRRLAIGPANPVGVWRQSLTSARLSAPVHSGVGKSVDPSLEAGFTPPRDAYQSGRTIPFQIMDALRVRLEAELTQKFADELPALNALQMEFRELAEYASERWQEERHRLLSYRARRFATGRASLCATTLGNVAAAHTDLIYRRYGINIEVYWLQIQKLAQTDEKFSLLINDSQTRVDVSVSLAAVTALFTVTWSLILLAVQGPLLAYVLVLLIGCGSTAACYQMCVANTYTYFSAVRAAIELYRFDLFRQLHVALPANSDTERATWRALSLQAQHGEENISYSHV